MENKNKELGIYIHIPFCVKKCYYCDFTSFAGCDNFQEKYVECLKDELKQRINETKDNYKITTIYIGGGTPSYIDTRYIKEIIEQIVENIYEDNSKDLNNNRDRTFNINYFDDIELTIEVNPGTVTEQKLIDYKEIGINRLSIGLQSTNNKLLKEIGRIHSFEQFEETYNLARKAGFENINIDLMLGLPNQTIKDLKHTLQEIIRFNPEHISVYSLILEDGTKLCNLVKQGKLRLPNEDLERQMYWYVKNTLELNGYKHYEISNFAKMGYESKHNVNCWKQKEYIGVGLAASSYLDGIRYLNVRNLNDYINNIEEGYIDKNKIIEEVQKDEGKQKEFMMLGLRMIDGVSIQEFKIKFCTNPLYIFREELERLAKDKLIKVEGDNIKLTNKGLDLANQVWMEFV